MVASLVYLAFQIRQNTRQVRASMQRAFYADALTLNTAVYADAEMSDLVERGLADRSTLSGAELSRFVFYSFTTLQGFEAVYLQHRSGTLDEDFWQAKVELMRWWFSHPGMARILDEEPGPFVARSFLEFLRRELASGDA